MPPKPFDHQGMDLVNPVNRIPNGRTSLSVNVRSYVKGGVTFRNLLTDAILTLAAAVHTIRRLNDLTPNGPPSGYIIISGAATTLYAGPTAVAVGLSGNPMSIVPFRPNTSVQPWAYSADNAADGDVTITTKYLISGDPTTFVTYGMLKTRSDKLCYRAGVKEPQLAPVVSTQNTSKVTEGTLFATAIPWTNYTGQNPSYDYGESNGFPSPTPDGTAPFAVDVQNASFVTITALTGSATINGGTATPTTLGPSTGVATNPGHFVMVGGTGMTPPATATVVIGAFTDGSGNVIPAGVAPLYVPSVVDVGAVIGVTNGIQVPYGAVSFQIGINSTGNTFSANSGSFALTITVTTDALPTVTSTLGNLTIAYFGDSPVSGPVSAYIWKNADDPGGSGPVRSALGAVGTTSGNSFIFDATFTAGIPALPGIGDPSLPMLWTQLNPDSTAVGANPVFTPAIKGVDGNTAYQNFNFCLTGSIYIPAPGNYTFVLTNHDDVIWGIGGDATLVSATAIHDGGGVSTSISGYGQTISVVSGLPLLPRGNYPSGGGAAYTASTVIVHFSTAGIKAIEIDFDYWYHSGRILLLSASPTPGGSATIIPPLPSSVRQDVQYRYVYRSTATGAQSNPSPESAAETIPVSANTITSLWSPDPQVDVVDYYRIDFVVANFTYVGTGPNDDLGTVPGTNTPITDSLLDTELGSQLLDYDNFEPFPSIDLPQKGVVNVSGGVITWVSGGAIGGTATGFNIRWLAGTEILIGSPTSLAYTFIARPTSTTSVTIPGVPDGTNLAYEIPEPILAAQPLPYMFGITDNVNFAFAVGDPLRPGTLYWCNGSNLDAAADTNSIDVCSPDEPLVNGAITSGLGALFSIKRGWLILPNFFNAVATVTGTEGSTWTLQESSITRGLYMPRCVCVSGGGLIFFRVDDGVHASVGGASSQSITDEDLYPLFPHESPGVGTSAPQSVTRQGITIYPPDDSLPQLQKFSIDKAYLYYDYQGTDSNPHTLVFDLQAMGWVWDLYDIPATIHAADEGPSSQGTLVGCSDGTIRLLSSVGTETITGIVQTPAIGGRGFEHTGMMVCEYSSTSTITLTGFPVDEGNGSYGPIPITLPSTGGQLTKYFFRPSANKYKLLVWQFSSNVPYVLNFQGAIAYTRSWGSSSEYTPTPIFGSAGGEG